MGITIEKSWHEKLKEEIQKPYIKELKEFLEKEKAEGQIIYPPENSIFHAFTKTPYDNVKVVIVGQDPYHGRGQAHGLSFSVLPGITPPPSLKNIFKELESDLGLKPPSHGCLDAWAEQGVLLLNTTLTVRAGNPKSHHGRGWEPFTDAIIDLLAKRKDPIVFLLWGKSAQEKGSILLGSDFFRFDRVKASGIENREEGHISQYCPLRDLQSARAFTQVKTKEITAQQCKLIGSHHAVFIAAHPSPYSATGFLGCKHFSKANSFLKSVGKEPVNWSLNG